jgi:hypothetical protein
MPRVLALLGAVLGSASVAASACAPALPPPLPPRPSLVEGAAATPAYATPAAWRYHPPSEAPLLARAEVEGGKLLFAGERGERWLFDTQSRRAQAAARLAPEPLVTILRPAPGSWVFVGQSGSSYEAAEPLGPFLRASAPLDRLADVTASSSAIVGVRVDGALVRTGDGGATWKRVGPTARFSDALLLADGHGLALAIPEALYATTDHGATWSRIDTPPFGATSLGRDAAAGLVARTPVGPYAWQPAGSAPFVRLARLAAGEKLELKSDPPRGPDAAALVERRAVIAGRSYLEVLRNVKEAGWDLLRGPVDGRLERMPIELSRACTAVRMAAFERWVWIACLRGGDGVTSPVELYRSADGGRTFTVEPYDLEASLGSLVLAAGDEGRLLVSGICPIHTAKRGCRPTGVHYRRPAKEDASKEAARDAKKDADRGARDEERRAARREAKPAAERDGPSFEMAPAAVPSLKGSADAIAFSADGRIAYAAGRRSKDGSYALFVSRDGGRGFEAQQIDAPAEPEPAPEAYWRRPALDTTRVEAIGAAEDGLVALMLRRSAGVMLVVTDEEGRTVAMSEPPQPGAALGAAGARAIAVGTDRDVWESLDGGSSWEPVGRLPAPACDGTGCAPAVACHVGGCVVGSVLSRIGWRGQADDDRGVLSPSEAHAPELYDRKLKEPIACTLEEAPWKKVSQSLAMPGAAQAAFGRVAWFAITRDDATGAAAIVQAGGGPRARVETVSLLAASREDQLALAVVPQIEGAAALRYRIVAAKGAALPEIRDVEVAWANLLESKVQRQRIASLGTHYGGDSSHARGRVQTAQPALLSVTAGGVYLRIHNYMGEQQSTLFLDGRGTTTLPPIAWPGGLGAERADFGRVGRAHVAARIVEGGAAVVRARQEGAGWAFDAMACGLGAPGAFGLNQSAQRTYSGGAPGVLVRAHDPLGVEGWASFHALRASGAALDDAVPVPTQLDAGDRPSRCSARQLDGTPRVVVGYSPGTRHPVIVYDAAEPQRTLLTSSAVLYGAPRGACVAAYDAESIAVDPDSGPSTERAILAIDDLEHAWLLRPAGDAAFEYRPMSCRFDSTLEVPPELWGAAGTLVRRRR